MTAPKPHLLNPNHNQAHRCVGQEVGDHVAAPKPHQPDPNPNQAHRCVGQEVGDHAGQAGTVGDGALAQFEQLPLLTPVGDNEVDGCGREGEGAGIGGGGARFSVVCVCGGGGGGITHCTAAGRVRVGAQGDSPAHGHGMCGSKKQPPTPCTAAPTRAYAQQRHGAAEQQTAPRPAPRRRPPADMYSSGMPPLSSMAMKIMFKCWP
jgi:hypothetical protein